MQLSKRIVYLHIINHKQNFSKMKNQKEKKLIKTKYLYQRSTGYNSATYLYLAHPFIEDAFFCFFSRNCDWVLDYKAPTIKIGEENLLLAKFDSPRINPMPAICYGSTLNSIKELMLFSTTKEQIMDINIDVIRQYEDYINSNYCKVH